MCEMRLFWRVGIAPNAVFFHPEFCGFARSQRQILKTRGCGGSAAQDGGWRPNLHHAVARERFGSQNREALAASEHFLKLSSAKFAQRLFEVEFRKILRHAVARERFGSQNR